MLNRTITALSVVEAVLGLVLFGLPSALAQDLASGRTWLETHQGGDGFWGGQDETPFRDTECALDALIRTSGDATCIALGREAVSRWPAQSVDCLAAQVYVSTLAKEGASVDPQSAFVAEMQNADGGWGAGTGYMTNNLDTALCLRGLGYCAAFDETSIISAGLTYLTTRQNADGGWGFTAGAVSTCLYTAQALLALERFRDGYSVGTAIQNGTLWLRNALHPDGGLGTGGTSNPYESGLALAAISRGAPTAAEIALINSHLLSSQLPNGSWRDDAYSTATALLGLVSVSPDLSVSAIELTFSNSVPTDSATVLITAAVHNWGPVTATGVHVGFYDGDPRHGGAQIGGEQNISSLSPGSLSSPVVSWSTLGKGGDHTIFILVDPNSEIAEGDEFNNLASRLIHVSTSPDVAITSEDISFDPPDPQPGDPVSILVKVRNCGELPAVNVTLQIYDGDPNSGGIPFLDPPASINAIAGGETYTYRLDLGGYFPAQGEYLLCATGDVNRQVRERNELNNSGCRSLWVGLQCQDTEIFPGLVLLGLPLLPSTPVTSYQLLAQSSFCKEVDWWDRSRQEWRGAFRASGEQIVGDDSTVEPREGFFARAAGRFGSRFCGERASAPGCTDLSPGLNLISIPDGDACYTGYDLMSHIPQCDEASAWDRGYQMWNSVVTTGTGEILGEDFEVRPGYGYFARVAAGGRWCTEACDTLVSQPDLVITTDDIYIDPNPVQSGQPVVVAVNVQNIGTVTAVAPRMDIYLGNPDEGGFHFGYLDLPDIPAGQSSGFYGGQLTLTGQGIVEVWGVADINNTIVESSETNNRAHADLQVNAAALASKESSSRVVPTADKPARVVPVTSARRTETNPIAAGDETGPVAKVPRPAEPNSITHVTAGNHSSSAVTVAWVTDVPTDGCVHFGTNAKLGSVAWEQGEPHAVHRVVLDGLRSETTYYFKVVSGGLEDDHGGSLYSITTAKPGVGIPSVLYGSVVEATGGPGVLGIAVAGTLIRAQGSSHPVIGLTNNRGQWLLNLGNLKDPASGDVFAYAPGDRVVLDFLGPEGAMVADTLTITGEGPQDCGAMPLQVPSDLTEPSLNIPDLCYLATNYPNPFSRTTRIAFGLPVASRINVSVYNVSGQRIAALAEGEYAAGHHVLDWDGRNSHGVPVSSGIYFYQLRANGFDQVRRMFILR